LNLYNIPGIDYFCTDLLLLSKCLIKIIYHLHFSDFLTAIKRYVARCVDRCTSTLIGHGANPIRYSFWLKARGTELKPNGHSHRANAPFTLYLYIHCTEIATREVFALNNTSLGPNLAAPRALFIISSSVNRRFWVRARSIAHETSPRVKFLRCYYNLNNSRPWSAKLYTYNAYIL